MLQTSRSFKHRLVIGLAAALFLCSLVLFATNSVFAQGSADALPGRLDTPSPEFPGLDKGLFLDISRAGSRVIAVGMHGSILYSDDQGNRWTQARVPVSVLLTAVHFVNERLGWAVGHNGVVLHSADGGASWQRQLDGWQIDQMVLAYAELNLKAVQAAPVVVEPEIVESEILGAEMVSPQIQNTESLESPAPTAEPAADAAPETVVLDVTEAVEPVTEPLVVEAETTPDPSEPSRSAQDDYPDFLKMDDSGADDLLYIAESMLFDAKTDASVGADKPLLDVLFLDERHGFVIGAYGLMLETTDAGKSWHYVGHRIENTDRFHLNAMVRVGAAELWLVGEAGALFRSGDRGQHWETLTGPYEGTYFGAQPVGSGVLIYGLRGHAFYSRDQGASWQRLVTEADSTLTASVLANDGTVFVFGYGGTVLQWQPGQDHMRLQPRKGFSTYLGVVGLDSGRMLVVGDRGVNEFVRE